VQPSCKTMKTRFFAAAPDFPVMAHSGANLCPLECRLLVDKWTRSTQSELSDFDPEQEIECRVDSRYARREIVCSCQ
jgi:hypothetical protein